MFFLFIALQLRKTRNSPPLEPIPSNTPACLTHCAGWREVCYIEIFPVVDNIYILLCQTLKEHIMPPQRYIYCVCTHMLNTKFLIILTLSRLSHCPIYVLASCYSIDSSYITCLAVLQCCFTYTSQLTLSCLLRYIPISLLGF